MGAVAQRPKAGDVVGVKMGVHGLDELEIELPYELEIAVNLFQHRIDDQTLSAGPAGEQVGVGAGCLVEELAEDHDAILSSASKAIGLFGRCCRSEYYSAMIAAARLLR
jgi:hypothetical protein